MHLQIIVGDRCPTKLSVATQQPMWGEALRDQVLSQCFATEPTEAELPILKPMEAFGGSFVQVSGLIQLDAESCRQIFSGNFNPAHDCAEVLSQIFGECLGPNEGADLHVNLRFITYGATQNVEDHFISTASAHMEGVPSLA